MLALLLTPILDILSELYWRGLVHQMTDTATSLTDWLQVRPRTVYAGFDPTADSLHVGHLLPLLNLRRFQQFGHCPIALAGGATGTIGDPSGKSEERKLITVAEVEHNVRSIEKQIRKFLRFDDSPSSAILVNNYDWLSKFTYIDFLRDVGKHFSVNVMMAKESVKMRLGNNAENTDAAGLSFTEFSYMLMQSYDFVHLYRTYGCEMQIGGSDQWGNITLGCDFGRRLGILKDGDQLCGLTSPLITKSDGGKMGKTESGALWLDPNRTPPYQFYQYWVNLDDADVEKMLKVFTDLNAAEIDAVMAEHGSEPSKRVAQRRLAEEFTRLVHGEEGLSVAKRATDILFGGEIDHLSDAQLASIFADVPSRELPRDRLENGLPVIDAFVESTLCKTKGDARRSIQQGGAYINNRRVASHDVVLGLSDLASVDSANPVMVLRVGKKNYALLRFV